LKSELLYLLDHKNEKTCLNLTGGEVPIGIESMELDQAQQLLDQKIT